MRGINNDSRSRSIATQANICYDSTAFNDPHDEEFHEYDVVNRNTSVQYENIDQGTNTPGPVPSSAQDSVFGDYQNEGYVNQGISALGKGQPSSSQCDSGNKMTGHLPSSVHLTVVPCEYEIPVHSNSAYEIPNGYENWHKNAIIALWLNHQLMMMFVHIQKPAHFLSCLATSAMLVFILKCVYTNVDCS